MNKGPSQYLLACKRAKENVEKQEGHMPCQNPANNLINEFLLEVRNSKLASGGPESSTSDTFIVSLKKASNGIINYPFRVYSAASAQEVPGIGPMISKIISEQLFSLYPPSPPTEEEEEQMRKIKAELRAKEAEKRKKRKAEDAAARLRVQQQQTAARTSQPPPPVQQQQPQQQQRRQSDPPIINQDDEDVNMTDVGEGSSDDETTTRRGRGRGRPAAATRRQPASRRPRQPKEYIPNIGTANYAFLIVLLQAQKGPEKRNSVSKQELMSLTEASGLANKPIHGEGGAGGPGAFNPGFNSRQWYDGWSNFKRLISAQYAYTFSNPLQCSLTDQGRAIAERLYRDAVLSGKAAEVPGLPATGPLLFQLTDQPAVAPVNTTAANGALPSVALRPNPPPPVVPPPRVVTTNTAAAAKAVAKSKAATNTATAATKKVSTKPSIADELRAILDERKEQPPIQPASNPTDVPLAARLAQRLNNPPATTTTNNVEVIALLSDDEDDEQQAPPTTNNRNTTRNEVLIRRSVPDHEVAQLMDMGFSDRKARRALRRSTDIGDALDIIDLLESDGEDSEKEEALPPTEEQPEQQRQQEPTASDRNGAIGHIRAGAQREARIRITSQTQNGVENPLPVPRPAPSDSWQQRQQALYNTTNQQADAESRPPRPTSTTTNIIEPSGEAVLRLPPLQTGRKFSDSYRVVLLVDGREQYSRNAVGAGQGRSAALNSHLTRMQSPGLSVEHRTLPIGDALWVARSLTNPSVEYVLDFVLERKSLNDLLQSIKGSNRYNSQKYFMKKSGLRYLYYLVEGDPNSLGSIPDQKTVKSASTRTEVIDGFKMLRTAGVNETFRLYQSMTQHIAALYADKQQQQLGGEKPLMTFEEFKQHMRVVDKGGTTLHDVWGCMLSEVNGLGIDAVSIILQHYPTPISLWKEYRSVIVSAHRRGESGVQAAEQLLAGLRNQRSGRALGTEKAKKVFHELFASDWDIVGLGV